ncbi:MBG domain-containing protein [Gluconacetobacter dulcium]|uniref:MBG domain-containing protein n=1 Tax=Gluconacetobacter dulcium TaxID=2729096 RepID=UPI00287BAF85|nr:MBG domain-containing protein [Gluconacetobacter dulcium]
MGNYTVSYVPGTLTIDPAALTVTALDQASTYGQTPALGNREFSTAGLVNGDTVSSVALTTAATGASSVGTYGIAASGATGSGLSNYAVTYRGGTLTIDPAALTVTALDQSSTYGQAPDLGTSQFSTSGLVNGDTVSGVTLTTAATGASSVGAYGIAASGATGAGLGNYTVSYVPGTLTIDPAALTVTALDQASTYGQAPDLGTSQFSTSGLVNGDTVSAVTLATPATGTSNVGHYGITAAGATGTGLSNYAVTYRGGTLTIDPAALTVTALDQSSTYGNSPALGSSAFSTSGLVNGDTVSAVRLTTTATAASTVGTYTIAASTATGDRLGNYHVNYRPGALSVVMAPSSATAGLSADLRSQGVDSLTGIVSQGLNTAFVADHVSAIATLSGISSAHETSGSSTVVWPHESAGPDEVQTPEARSTVSRPAEEARSAAPARALPRTALRAHLPARLTSRNDGNILTPPVSARNQIAR